MRMQARRLLAVAVLSIFGLSLLVGLPTVSAGGMTATSVAAAAQRPVLDYGDTGPAVADLQRRLGMRNVPARFGKATLTKVINFQISRGLRPDGVVGAATWPYVLNPRLPARGTPFVATGARRAAVDKKNNTVFLINPNGTVARWSWMIDNNRVTRTGVKRVSQELLVNRDLKDTGEPGNLLLENFTRIDGGIGFHRIPIDKTSKKQIHSEAALGVGTRQVSSGCIRLTAEFARYLQSFLRIGSRVDVVSRL